MRGPSLGGRFPSGRTPFGNLLAARRLAVFLGTGRVSQTYPAAKVCEDLRLLHAAGLSVTLRQYPCGDELMPQMLGDLDRWIIEQISQAPEPSLCRTHSGRSRTISDQARQPGRLCLSITKCCFSGRQPFSVARASDRLDVTGRRDGRGRRR